MKKSQYRQQRKQSFESLESRQMFSVTTMEVEPNNRLGLATEVATDATDGQAEVLGSVDSSTDRDYFRFLASETGQVSLSVNSPNGLIPQIEIKDRQGVKLFETQPKDGINGGSFTVTPGERLSMRVRGVGRTTGDYRVLLSLSDTVPGGGNNSGGSDGVPTDGGTSTTIVNEVESNDRKVRANRFAFPIGSGSAEINGEIADRRDRDYYRFVADKSGSIHLSIQSHDGLVGKVEVEAANGVKVFETEPNDGVNAGRFSVTEGSVYFLRVRAQGKTAGTYQVSLQSGDVLPPTDPAPVLPSDVTEVESNDSKAAANAFVIAADGTARLNGHIDSADDRDFFAFRADKTGNIDADIIAVGGLTADIEVETEASVKVFETDANDGITSGSFPVTEGQRYFVRVRGKNDSIGSYIVNLAYAGSGGGGTSSSGTNGDSTGGPSGLPTGMIVEVENNNTESLANVFALDGNGRAVLSGVSINDNDKDFFAVTPTASGTLRFDVASPNGEHAQLQVTNRLGAKLFETDPNDGRNSGQVQVTAGEKIYVRLRAKDDAAAEYAVDVAFAELGQ